MQLRVGCAGGALTLIALSLASCSKPPEKVCDHSAEISPLLAQKECVDTLTQFQKKDPAKYDAYAKCAMGSKNLGTLAACNEEYHPGAASAASAASAAWAAAAKAPAPPEEAKIVLLKIIDTMVRKYVFSRGMKPELCPSAGPVPASLAQLAPTYVPSIEDWKKDAGWTCFDSLFFSTWRVAQHHWQYEFRNEGGTKVTVYAHGKGDDGKTRQIAKSATVENGKLIATPNFVERDLTEAEYLAEQCAANKAEITASATRHDFAAARSALARARAACPVSESAQADATEKQIAAVEAAWMKEQADAQAP